MISIFASRLLGVLRDTVMASLFGANDATDAYRLAFQIPDLVFYLLSVGSLSAAFIPIFSEYYQKDKKESWDFFASINFLLAIFSFIIIAILWFCSDLLMDYLAPGKSIEIRNNAASMSRILLPAQFAFIIGSVLSGTLYVRSIFHIPAITGIAYNLFIIISAIGGNFLFDAGINSMCWGALFGAYIGAVLIPVLYMLKLEKHPWMNMQLNHPGIKRFALLALPVLLSLSLTNLLGIITQIFVSYYDSGVNTAVDLANKLIQAPMAVIGQASGMAAFPVLANLINEKRMNEFVDQVRRSTLMILLLSILVASLFGILRKEIVVLLFQYGKFTAGDAERIQDLLVFYSLQIVPCSLLPFITRVFYASQNTVLPTILNTITTVLFVFLGYMVVYSGLSYQYMPICSFVCTALLCVALYIIFSKKYLQNIQYAGLGLLFMKLIAFYAYSTLIGVIINKFLGDIVLVQEHFSALIKICIVSSISVLNFMVFLHVFGFSDVNAKLKSLIKRV